MGSGCSRGSSSVLIARSQQPRPPSKGEPSVGNRLQEETVSCEIKTEDEPTKEGKETETGRLRRRDGDEDLQLLDELLEESQDCLSDNAPKFKEQTVESRCHLTSPLSGPQIYGERPLNPDTSWTIQGQPQLQPTASLLHNIHFRQQDSSSNIVLKTRNTQDAENNNLPYQLQGTQEAVEEKPALKYNKSEEALMEVITRQYSQ
ncbi:uncharacterized protein LOC108717180 [Xenopus laevis]|uniref:Uncharacterized protein LOC108717180 n=2 Tax=Xenopus laevis TaxID=8355 RepID=A0A1L8GBT9_XENLA|nr:uncharacterized protein LOC108717180 [Xenopus laevis]OCT81224.1 hypothetical protein XELAEV_18028039mg [Xenopus laevis]